MVPPLQAQQQRRTQTAADSLLLVTRPNIKANAECETRKRPRNNIANTVSNPYTRTNSIMTSNKRPLHDVNRRVANGGLVAQNASNYTNNPPHRSAFQRRNARDKGSNHNLPPTGTDRALVALLDGPSKKQKLRKKQKWMGKIDHTITTSFAGLANEKASINVASQSEMASAAASSLSISPIKQANRPKLASTSSCMVLKPPPMSSRSSSFTTLTTSAATIPVKPRKRVSSHINKISSSITNGKESSWMSERKAVIGGAFSACFGRSKDDENTGIGGNDAGEFDADFSHDDDDDIIVVPGGFEINEGKFSSAIKEVGNEVPTTYGSSQLKLSVHAANSKDNTLASRQDRNIGCGVVSKVSRGRKSEALVQLSLDADAANPSLDAGKEKDEILQSDSNDDDDAATTTRDPLEEPLVEDSTYNGEQTSIDFVLDNQSISKKSLSEWYDPHEQAETDKEAEIHAKTMEALKEQRKRNRKQPSSHGINDNFVRLDLKNSAGSCRGARNLKKINKQKLWRAQHRFGMSDPHGNRDSGDESNPCFNGKKGCNKRDGGDVKCFSFASNAGVDPLDDFMDGVFCKKTSSEKKSSSGQSHPTRPTRDNGVPLCTRHQRPCKLLTVKKNNKGNKGRKFYVCSMPKGEQCDFFKWEEDTIEATQRALLLSSSNSGFIARQVAASRTRFKELTVPELRSEAKRRGLKSTGSKDQILTRLLIWVRDEIAKSVENDGLFDLTPPAITSIEDLDAVCGEGDIDSEDDIDVYTASKTSDESKMIELSDDEDESSSDDDELEVCHTCGDKLISKENRSDKYDPRSYTLRDSLKHYFGYSNFREGQEWAIDRCLSGKHSLLVAPTGQGKSLCYALPAAISDGLCLVVSPLISLMQDQLRQLPPKITAATLSGSMTSAQMALIVDDVLRGRVKVLYVSPERLASAAFRRLLRPKFNPETRRYERQFPEVSLLCVDEAHCLSQWGHNFRPSYLRVRSLLSLIKPTSVLALTATAGPMVICDICNTLCIPFDGQCTTTDEIPSSLCSSADNGGGVRVLNCNRDNIDVFSLVLQDHDERRFLLRKLLKEKKFEDDQEGRQPKKLPIKEGCLSKGSVIVYVWRQKDTEIVAEQLNGAGVLGGVVCYHGGMNASDRIKAQSKFLRGKARICVATVAFGLGINKPDIEGVIHLCLPPSPEHYLQEIGRAGRDGRPAKAIALPLVDEFISRHSLAHSDRLSNSQLSYVFFTIQNFVNEAVNDISPEVDFSSNETLIDNLHVAIPIARAVDACDCKEESIETMLSLLEEENSSHKSLLSVEGFLPDTATITLKKCSLEKLSNVEEVARSIEKCGTRVDQPSGLGDFGGTALEKGFYAYSFGTFKFSVVRCARCMGPIAEPRHVYAALRRLQEKGELELSLDVTPNGRALHVRLTKDGINLFRKRPPGAIEDRSDCGSIEGMKTLMSKQFSAKEKISVDKVQSMYDIVRKVSIVTLQSNVNEERVEEEKNRDKSARLAAFQSLIQTFFKEGVVSKVAAQDGSVSDIKDFPLDNARLLSCLSSDATSIIQVLSSRRQERNATEVQIGEHADYRNLSISKILHGIDAPRTPVSEWYSHILWGKYRSFSFTSILKAVEKVLEEN